MALRAFHGPSREHHWRARFPELVRVDSARRRGASDALVKTPPIAAAMAPAPIKEPLLAPPRPAPSGSDRIHPLSGSGACPPTDPTLRHAQEIWARAPMVKSRLMRVVANDRAARAPIATSRPAAAPLHRTTIMSSPQFTEEKKRGTRRLVRIARDDLRALRSTAPSGASAQQWNALDRALAGVERSSGWLFDWADTTPRARLRYARGSTALSAALLGALALTTIAGLWIWTFAHHTALTIGLIAALLAALAVDDTAYVINDLDLLSKRPLMAALAKARIGVLANRPNVVVAVLSVYDNNRCTKRACLRLHAALTALLEATDGPSIDAAPARSSANDFFTQTAPSRVK